MKSVKVLIMAGGTGGHVYPALAVAERLHRDGARVAWLGTAHGLEAEPVRAAGYGFYSIPPCGWRRASCVAFARRWCSVWGAT